MEVTYYFSVASPFTFLGHATFGALAARFGAVVRHRPLDLGRVLAATGGQRLPDRSPQRQRYRLEEMRRWGRRRGLPILEHPACHGASRALASGIVLAAQRRGMDVFALADWIMAACWLHDRDIAEPAMQEALCARFGVEDGLIAAALSDEIQSEWQQNTDEAIAAGVFGVPTYVVGPEMFWGQDQLALVEEALRTNAGGTIRIETNRRDEA